MLIQADARRIPLADQSVQCVVTSPPYWGLRCYGVDGQLGLERTPDEYVANMVTVFREVRRVLRDDGVLWLNLGDSYAAGGQNGGSTADDLTPKQRSNAGCRYERRLAPAGLKPKDLVGIPWRVAFALQADGWYLRSDVIWSKPNPMPESVTDRPTKAHEYLFLLTKSARYYWDQEAVREQSDEPDRVRFDRIGGKNGEAVRHSPGGMMGQVASRNVRTVWTIATQPYSGAHYAVMPEKLVERCVLAGSKAGDRVFDPFVGSGTAVKVARNLARIGIGLDLNGEYLTKQAAKRIRTQAGLALC